MTLLFGQTLIASSVGLFLVFLPLWMFFSSYVSMVLLMAVGCASVFLVLTTYANAKAADAETARILKRKKLSSELQSFF